MNQFLLLFSAYRDLVLSEGAAASRLEAAEARIAELESELRRVNESHKQDLRNATDSYSRQATGRHVFARSEAPIAPAQPAAPIAGRRFARDVAREKTAEERQKFIQGIRAELQQESEAQSA